MTADQETREFLEKLSGHPYEADVRVLMKRMAEYERIRRGLPRWAFIRRRRAVQQIETSREFANSLLSEST